MGRDDIEQHEDEQEAPPPSAAPLTAAERRELDALGDTKWGQLNEKQRARCRELSDRHEARRRDVSFSQAMELCRAGQGRRIFGAAPRLGGRRTYFEGFRLNDPLLRPPGLMVWDAHHWRLAHHARASAALGRPVTKSCECHGPARVRAEGEA